MAHDDEVLTLRWLGWCGQGTSSWRVVSICLKHFIGATYGLSHLRFLRLRVIAFPFDRDGRIGEEPVQYAVSNRSD